MGGSKLWRLRGWRWIGPVRKWVVGKGTYLVRRGCVELVAPGDILIGMGTIS